jgi:hypothetical protein
VCQLGSRPSEIGGYLVTLLDDYIPRRVLAKQLGDLSDRTIARYEAAPDGLPSTIIGGRKFYRLEAVRAWLAARERRPNPQRR